MKKQISIGDLAAATAATSAGDVRDTCGLCSGRALEPLVSIAGTEVVRCKTCGAGFVAALPRRRAAEEYAPRYAADADGAKAHACWRLLEASGLLQGRRRVLDVGCGRGHFLDRAREAGLATTGIELDVASAQAARAQGHSVWQQSATAGPWPGEAKCDLITCWDLLEHLDAPGEPLKWAAQAIESGGVFVAATPYIGSVYDKVGLALHRATGGRATQLLKMCWSADHLYRFDADGLARVARSVGFTNVVTQKRLLLSLHADRYAGGAILPSWTGSGAVDRLLSHVGVAVSRALRFTNKIVLVAYKS